VSVSTTNNFLALFFSERRGAGTSKDFITVLEKKKKTFLCPFCYFIRFLVHSLRVVILEGFSEGTQNCEKVFDNEEAEFSVNSKGQKLHVFLFLSHKTTPNRTFGKKPKIPYRNQKTFEKKLEKTISAAQKKKCFQKRLPLILVGSIFH